MIVASVNSCRAKLCSIRASHRIAKGTDSGAWYHEHFLRGAPEKMTKMVRVKVKGKAEGKAEKPKDDPDFYSMPPLPLVNTSRDREGRQRRAMPSRRVTSESTSTDEESCLPVAEPILCRSVSDMPSMAAALLVGSGYSSADNASTNLLASWMKQVPIHVPSVIGPSDGDIGVRTTVGWEPLPFKDEAPADEFAAFIDNMIHVV